MISIPCDFISSTLTIQHAIAIEQATLLTAMHWKAKASTCTLYREKTIQPYHFNEIDAIFCCSFLRLRTQIDRNVDFCFDKIARDILELHFQPAKTMQTKRYASAKKKRTVQTLKGWKKLLSIALHPSRRLRFIQLKTIFEVFTTTVSLIFFSFGIVWQTAFTKFGICTSIKLDETKIIVNSQLVFAI